MFLFARMFLFFIICCTPSLANSVLITGANQGIGMGFVKHYLQKDYKVYATFRSKEKSEELLAFKQANLIPIQVDFEEPAIAAEKIKNTLKGDPLDVLILNAGYFPGKANKSGEIEANDFQVAFTVNVVSPLMIVQALKENLTKGNEKKIVALSSRRGSIQLSREDNYTDRFGYRSSKAALNAEMSALSSSMPTITVLILHPGRVSTALTNHDPMGISVEKSVEGMMKLISACTLAESGKFYDYEGQDLPW